MKFRFGRRRAPIDTRLTVTPVACIASPPLWARPDTANVSVADLTEAPKALTS